MRRDEIALPSAVCAPAILHTQLLRRDLRTRAIPAAIESRQTSFGTPRGCLRGPKTSGAARLPLLSRPRLHRSRANGSHIPGLVQTAENRDSSRCNCRLRIRSPRLHALQIRYPSQTHRRECCPAPASRFQLEFPRGATSRDALSTLTAPLRHSCVGYASGAECLL